MIVKQICCCQWFWCREICSLSMHTLETDFVVNSAQCIWTSTKVKVNVAEFWIVWLNIFGTSNCHRNSASLLEIFFWLLLQAVPPLLLWDRTILRQPMWQSLHFPQPDVLKKCYFKGKSNLDHYTIQQGRWEIVPCFDFGVHVKILSFEFFLKFPNNGN